MGVKTLIGSAVGLGSLVASLFTPMIPSNAYTFTASNDGRCEVRQEGRQSPYSWLRGKLSNLGNGDLSSKDLSSKEDLSQRVVGVYNISYKEDDRRFINFGTGYVLDDGLVLTANHVINDMKNPYVSDGMYDYEATVVDRDAEKDLALLKIMDNVKDNLEPIRIGEKPKPDEHVTIRTLDVKDRFYQNPDSRRDLNQVRYNVRISPESRMLIQELEGQKTNLQLQINELDKEIDALIKPYLSSTAWSSGEEIPPRKLGDSLDVVVDDDVEGGSLLYYRHRTDEDRFVKGMSGSGVFNGKGELVGIGVNTTVPVRDLSRAQGYAFPEGTPQDVIESIMKINERIDVMIEEITQIELGIYHIKNPIKYGAVSPLAIISFLQNYCHSIGAQTTSQSLEQSRIASLEGILELYPELNTPAYRRTFLKQFNHS